MQLSFKSIKCNATFSGRTPSTQDSTFFSIWHLIFSCLHLTMARLWNYLWCCSKLWNDSKKNLERQNPWSFGVINFNASKSCVSMTISKCYFASWHILHVLYYAFPSFNDESKPTPERSNCLTCSNQFTTVLITYLLFNTLCHCSLSALNHWLQSWKMQNNCLRKTGAVLFVSREIIRGNIIKCAK